MNAVALVKQVPDRNSAFRPAGDWIDESSLGYGINDYDRYAVEAVLALKEAGHAAETIAVTAGPADAGQVLRSCLAMGVDRGVHLVTDRSHLADPFFVARALADAVEKLEPAVVTAGLLAEDSGHGQVGGLVAGLLGYSFASAATAMHFRDGSLEVHRELEGGRIAVVALRLPAVVAVQTGINTPRYASLRGIMASRRKPVDRIDLAAPDDSSGVRGGLRGGLRRLTLQKPERGAGAEILQGSPAEVAAALVPRIRAGAGIAFPGDAV